MSIKKINVCRIAQTQGALQANSNSKFKRGHKYPFSCKTLLQHGNRTNNCSLMRPMTSIEMALQLLEAGAAVLVAEKE